MSSVSQPSEALREPPGPRGVPVFGVLPKIWRDPLAFFQDVAREQGPVARVGLGKFTLYLLSSPEAIQHVMQDNAANYWKGDGMAMVKPVMGDGLAVAEGDLWRRQRQLLQPAFQRRAVLDLAPLMQESVDAMLERWDGLLGQPLDVAVETSNLVQNLIWRTLFGEDLGEETTELGRALVEVNHYLNTIVWSLLPIPNWIPTPRQRRFRRAMDLLDRTVSDLIRRREGAPSERPDLLSRMIAARDPETGKGMSVRQTRDEIMTLFVAGHDTTAGAMAWTLALLDQNPDALARLHAEVDALPEALTPDALPFPYTERVIAESMRLYPPGWLLVRTPYEADTICGYHVPKGAPLLISQYVVHRHPELWDDPLRFDPDRFTKHASRGRPRYAYFPYGGGRRMCIGKAFAQVAIQLVIASVCRRFRLRLVPGHPLTPQPLTTLRAKHGVRMLVERR